MPSSTEILEGLENIANNWQSLAIFWHVYFGLLALALIAGIRLMRYLFGGLLALPLFSVSVLAWMTGNPFNGALFALVGIALLIIGLRLPREPVAMGPTWAVVAGTVMFVFGWVYPHFLETDTFLPYLYAAPMGLIPCPTLSAVIGLALVLRGLDSRLWSLVLGMAGVFYGFWGALRLGVTIDLVLLLGAIALIVLSLMTPSVAESARPRQPGTSAPGVT